MNIHFIIWGLCGLFWLISIVIGIETIDSIDNNDKRAGFTLYMFAISFFIGIIIEGFYV